MHVSVPRSSDLDTIIEDLGQRPEIRTARVSSGETG
jgi:hypothetical protein